MYVKKELRTFLKFSALYIAPLVMSLLYFYISISCQNALEVNKHSVGDSSVWCRGSEINSKLCKFKNVCYHPDSMSVLFFLGNLSVIKGLSDYREFQTIQLSSVNFHNKFEANVSVVDSNHEIVNFANIKRALMFSRFKPDNIMHVIHDDLIPLYLTLEDICLGDLTCQQSYTLIFHDSYPKGLFHDLYVIFSRDEPVLLSNLRKTLCFEELHMGLVKDSILYDYGFDKPQGPVQNVKLHSRDLLRFSSFMKQKLNVKADDDNNNGIVLVSRKKTRKILNEKRVINMLENAFGDRQSSSEIQVSCLDLYQDDIRTSIEKASESSALVGMHGAEMILSVFLKSNSTVVELFPYAIKPHVSFIKPLSNVKGIHFNYIYWENTSKNNSVFHPDADPLHGGIAHLPTDTQKRVQNVDEVPPVRCCNDPVYLYYMYQDTFIDSNFGSFLTEKLRETREKVVNTGIESEWFYPSSVTRIACSYDPTTNFINLTWSAPFNVRHDQVFYDIFLLSDNLRRNIITEETNLSVNVTGKEPDPKIRTWITSVMKTTKTKSKDVLIECNIS